MLWKVIGVGLCTVVISLILKQYKPELVVFSNICGGLIILMLAVDGVKDLIGEFMNLQNFSGVKMDVISPILKVIGVGYITEFTADVAEDSGNKSVANKVVLGGKIAICMLALPVIKTLISAIISLI